MKPASRAALLALAGLLAAGAGLEARAGTTAPSAPPAATPAAAGQTARAAESGPVFAALGRPQQQVLAPLAPYWHTLDASQKDKWLEVARRFPTLPAAEQQRIQQRMAEWARMTPAERGRARLQFQQARQFSPDERPARWEAYQLLPSEQREALARRARPEPAPGASPAPRGRAPGVAPDDGPGDAATAKRNVVTPRPPAPPKQVAPTMVQAKPGATTTLLTDKTAPPVHAQSGLPKIAAVQGFVDPRTLLPRRGPQGAGMAVSPAAGAADEIR